MHKDQMSTKYPTNENYGSIYVKDTCTGGTITHVPAKHLKETRSSELTVHTNMSPRLDKDGHSRCSGEVGHILASVDHLLFTMMIVDMQLPLLPK